MASNPKIIVINHGLMKADGSENDREQVNVTAISRSDDAARPAVNRRSR